MDEREQLRIKNEKLIGRELLLNENEWHLAALLLSSLIVSPSCKACKLFSNYSI